MSARTGRGLALLLLLASLAAVASHRLSAEPPGPPKPEAPSDADALELSGLPLPDGAKQLDPKSAVWVDMAKKQVLVDGKICLREGPMEVFACPKGTKEHEAIVSVGALPSIVHAGLLAVGAKPGKPAQFQPKYRPATGDEIEIIVAWKDAKGEQHQVRAQEMVADIPKKKNANDVPKKKVMAYPWVFAGSSFWTDKMNGQKYYMADGGEFICLSNFPGAMLDIPVESSESNEELEFAAFTEHIPPVGTKVRLVLTPKAGEKKAAE